MWNKDVQSNADISEKSKKALKSEIWEKFKKANKTETMHFTEMPEIQHFAMEKVNKNDGVYGVVWGNVVKEYLMTAYCGENPDAEVVSDGITYKVLKREGVAVFYDADGNTLFDVENKRLEKEYECVIHKDKMTAGSEVKITDLEKADKETGQAWQEKPEKKSGDGMPSGDISFSDQDAIKQRAKEKLEKEMKSAKDKSFAEPVIGYLLKRCKEDYGLAQDVMQEHKAWEKCFDYIYKQAHKKATGDRAFIRDEVVYEWAEDYYHKDDKAEEEEKAKKKAVARAKRKEAAADKTAAKPSQDKASNADKSIPVKKEKIKEHRKKSGKGIEGQLDMFSMMGM